MTKAEESLLAATAQPQAAERVAKTLRCRDVPAAATGLQRLGQLGIAPDLLETCLRQLLAILPASPNPDRGLANLVRYIEAMRSPQSLLALFERDSSALPTLMRILAASQNWAEQLISDPESFDLLRLTEGLPVSRGILVDELANEIAGSSDPQLVARSLRSHKQRETMRIAYGDFIGTLSLENVTQQLSVLAEAILETAVSAARREAAARFGMPLRADGEPARFAVLGYGQMGGSELSYAPRLDIMFVCDAVHSFRQQPAGHRGGMPGDSFERIAKRVVQLLSGDAQPPAPYSVATDLRPQGTDGPLAATFDAAVRYYEDRGETWERMAFIKARHVAGDETLSDAFLRQLEPWIYRRYLSRSDITEIAALKRRLEKRVAETRLGPTGVDTQPGGVRDIEFLIQFLQLLSGGELPEVRTGNTLEAIAALERTGCLTAQERSVLDGNYRFLRRIEHRLQIIFEQDTETLPEGAADLRQFLLASGWASEDAEADALALAGELSQRTGRNTRILDHLLHETFSSESGEVAPETDLILDMAPPSSRVDSVLSKYGFSDRQAAYRQLVALGQEQVSFLSSRRCRHFLSAIAPRLLQTLARTPSPDQTLANLARVSDSLGGKSILWELFQSSQAAMDLCVRLCASSPYLVAILTSHPGMIDELIDSLMLDRLPSTQQIESLLAELCHGVEDQDPVLHSFKNSMHLHIGVRDVLGKDDIVDTHRALSDVAEACIKQVIEHEYHRLVQKLGVPTITEGSRAGEAAELVVLAVGKLGGREPNYHSDLDVLFLFDADGATRSLLPHRRHDSIPNRIFFNQLGQRVVKSITRVGPAGHLYELDARLRPLGGGVGAAVTIDELKNYFCHGPAQLWERQALCKARPIWANPASLPSISEALREMLTALEWRPEHAADIQRHRLRLEQGAAETNIKRGVGGTLDIEFVVQMLQLRHARTGAAILVPGTIDALGRLQQAGFMSREHAEALAANYRWLRRVESGLRLMNLPARHDLPTATDQLDQLQFLIQPSTSRSDTDASLTEKCAEVRRINREIFSAIFGQA